MKPHRHDLPIPKVLSSGLCCVPILAHHKHVDGSLWQDIGHLPAATRRRSGPTHGHTHHLPHPTHRPHPNSAPHREQHLLFRTVRVSESHLLPLHPLSLPLRRPSVKVSETSQRGGEGRHHHPHTYCVVPQTDNKKGLVNPTLQGLSTVLTRKVDNPEGERILSPARVAGWDGPTVTEERRMAGPTRIGREKKGGTGRGRHSSGGGEQVWVRERNNNREGHCTGLSHRCVCVCVCVWSHPSQPASFCCFCSPLTPWQGGITQQERWRQHPAHPRQRWRSV